MTRLGEDEASYAAINVSGLHIEAITKLGTGGGVLGLLRGLERRKLPVGQELCMQSDC